MKYIVIIGGGRLGSHMADVFSEQGDSVVIIDNNAESFKNLGENFSGFTVEADGRELEVLEHAKMSKADAVLCVTNDDNTNLMIAEIATEIYKIKKVIARIEEPENRKIAEKLGLKVVCPLELSAGELERILGGDGSK